MDIKPHIPRPIEPELVGRLTPRQQLAQVRKSIAVARDARSYWPDANWTDALLSLERKEAELAELIRKTDEATFGKALLRPSFVNLKTGGSAKMIVRPPDEDFDMPHIHEDIFRSLRRCVGMEGEIEVQADYEVYVTRSNRVLEVIGRFDE